MELITKSQLRQARSSFENTRSSTALLTALNESKTRSSFTSEVTVFLSHKHSDAEEFKDAIALLKNRGVSVYVDWMDNDMPKYTSGITAAKIKSKIRENKKFILLATENAINSKWCNWELGLGDAVKYLNNIALLVVKDNDGSWTGNEYLQIYPVIGRKYSWSEDYYEVEFPDNTKIDLEVWLTRT